MNQPFVAALAALACALPVTAQKATAKPEWLTDYQAALAAAKRQQRPILADFTGSDWCGWCIKLKKEVFDTPEFAAWAKKNVVLLELDFPRKHEQPAALKKQNRELAKKHAVTGFPTVLFLDANGKEIGRTGYVKGGPKRWIAKAEKELSKASKAGSATPVWIEDYDEALRRAKRENKLVLADFTGSDWCGWCIKLKKEVFDTPEFAAWAKKNVVLLELDFPRRKKQSKELKEQNNKLRDRFGIRGYPTILFLDANGKKVGESGYVRGGPKAWIAAVEKELRGRK